MYKHKCIVTDDNSLSIWAVVRTEKNGTDHVYAVIPNTFGFEALGVAEGIARALNKVKDFQLPEPR